MLCRGRSSWGDGPPRLGMAPHIGVMDCHAWARGPSNQRSGLECFGVVAQVGVMDSHTLVWPLKSGQWIASHALVWPIELG